MFDIRGQRGLPGGDQFRTDDGFQYRSNQVTPLREKSLDCIPVDQSGRFQGTISEFAKAALQKNAGVFIGDSHGNFAITEKLIASMADLKNAGVSVLFFEMVGSAHQDIIDRCKQSGSASELETHLKKRWEKVDGMSRQYSKVVAAALAAGIEVRGIDTKHTGESRLESSNPHWVGVIKECMGDRSTEEKYLVFGGQGHAANYPFNKGVDFELGIPSLSLKDTKAQADYIQTGDGKSCDFVLGLKKSPNQPVDIFDSFG